MAPARSSDHAPSPGNAFSPSGVAVPPMRMPHLDFIYRIVCDMDPNVSEIANVDNTGVTRLVLPILSGSVKGPRITGKIVERSGADWAERIRPDKAFSRLHAMYTLQTDDGVFILVNAQGVFRTGPGRTDKSPRSSISQDDVEYFTHIRFEAPGGSPYDWMNAVVALGVMTMFEGRPIIDCYRLTNFPGVAAEKL
ncbi:hypothetical protein CPAR01_13451 [Colletotrichum paranaense]|uniref:Uncharacterized protein n=5 Tax=Colletotrichum acutatum species complex TaxID=2707335 RepID=A0A9P9X1E8_9PEZI|nr:uncharacterized protein CCOS01_08836 [Colletotrichum costaricense]XP_060344098.1 uncharacterized protein CPAR01_13451 [Colletotrichum paranaense]XP_060372712.1 uncharacterized protein CTAM01_16715 [Colletotrichum tamarilloi]XP_060398755.1 uncharacterized protein CABS01_10676 [Colletotrichum abscissum]KAI3537870.1 hypothetical protein CSPX01_09863 [Colletotrichum filicis]KAK0374083.1 hypothetical protein CLIM01_08565 [Colletotrichum limetticola]KAI3530923.1 hypothetical protein CABS02_14348